MSALEGKRPAFREVVIQMPIEPEEAQTGALVVELRDLALEMRQQLEFLKTSTAPTSFTEEDAAAELGMSVITLSRLRRDGKISYSRVAGRARYTKTQIEDYLLSIQQTRTGGKK